ncbi:MAG: hypothetical protein M3O74_13780 [Pseudomonadota bacterium]|nr:hypothetical protein [Pseudomonadota bacterium]
MNNINLARLTLERVRVKALHNEFSGQPFYRNKDGCHCAIGEITTPDVLEQIHVYGKLETAVGALECVPFYKGATEINVLDRLVEQTGLSIEQLDALQSAHDSRQPARDTANRAVLEWANAMLLVTFQATSSSAQYHRRAASP